MVFYRKYRPQTLDEIVGQEMVKQALISALSADNLSHAYLFCGPRGTGKTSTARILAKIVNCESGTLTLPCNSCSSCLSITGGSNLDVIEMDAASNRGIDDIRSLRENIKLSPTSAKKKVYIIDEVHMLSGEAFNALLKTLEEPPAHVLFILATTEVHKIPQTILSRVSKLDFKLASAKDLIEAMKKVAASEDMKIKDDALLLLAKSAQGSFRDGIKLLDLLSGFKVVDKGVVEEVFKTGVFESTCLFLESIAQKDTVEGLKKLATEVETGVNIKELTLSILEILRQLLLVKYGLGEQLVKPEVGEEKYASLENLGAKFDLNHLVYTINCFQTSLEQGRYVSIPSLPLEMAVVESCGIVQGSEFVVDSIESDKVKKSPEVELKKHEINIQPVEKEDLICKSSNNEQSTTDQFSDLQKISEKWTYVLETVRSFNYSLEALLRNAKITECSEHNIVVEVPYSFHQRILEAPKSKDLLESIFADILGRSVKVSAVLGQRPVRKDEIANVELAADDEIIRVAAEIFNSEPN